MPHVTPLAVIRFQLFSMRNHIHLLLLKFYKFHTFRQHESAQPATVRPYRNLNGLSTAI